MPPNNDPMPLTRKELAAFLPDQRSIRAFESLFERVPADLNEINIINEETSIILETINANINSVLVQLSDLIDHKYNIKTITGTYNAVVSDFKIEMNGFSASARVVLPANPPIGKYYEIVSADDTNTTDIDFNGKTFFGDPANYVLYKGESLLLSYNGSEWRI